MISAQNLSKSFGATRAVDSLSFEVPQGETLGLLGPNGAGKTTTMRMLTTYLAPTEGTAKINGLDILENPNQIRRQIGYMPENPPIYPEMLVTDFLKFVGTLKEIPKNQLNQRIEETLERLHLTEVRGRIIGHLSRGFRQRVGLAQALLHNPATLILDEPTLGLDPHQIIEIRNLIHSLKGKHTIIISSHILSEIEATCGLIAIIAQGKIVACDTLKKLTQDHQVSLEETFLKVTAL